MNITTETYDIGGWTRARGRPQDGPPPHRSPMQKPGDPAQLWPLRHDAHGEPYAVRDWDGCEARVLGLSQVTSGPSGAKARTTDPATSHAAAASVKQRPGHEAILAILDLFGPHTDEALYEWPEVRAVCSPSGARTRRAELVDMGLVRDTGRREKTAANRDTIVWEKIRK